MDRPPFVLMFDGDSTDPIFECIGWPDYEIYERVPYELRLEIVKDREDFGHLDGKPCLWLDDAGRCKHYDLRPLVCREFEPGEEACNDMRGNIGLVPLPLVEA